MSQGSSDVSYDVSSVVDLVVDCGWWWLINYSVSLVVIGRSSAVLSVSCRSASSWVVFSIVFIVICAGPTTGVLVGSRCLVAHGFARVVVFVVPLRGSQKHVVAELSGDVLNLLIIFGGYGQGSLFT